MTDTTTTDTPLIVVTVRDRSRELPWGHGLTSPRTTTVAIAAHCPRCRDGGVLTRRGRPTGVNTCDDGAWYWVQRWSNPCGHVDEYASVVTEADQITAARGDGRWVRVYPDAPAEVAALVEVDQARARIGRRALRPFLDGPRVAHEIPHLWVLGAARALVNDRPADGVTAIVVHTTRRLRLDTATAGPVDYLWTPSAAQVSDAFLR